MEPTTLVLADDHHLIRQALRTLLESGGRHRVVGEAADGLEALQLIETLQPAIAVVDLMLPGVSGLEVIQQSKRRAPQTRAIVLSLHASEAYVLQALHCGAAGYVLKGAAASELERAIEEALAGRRHLSPPLSERAIAAYADRAGIDLTNPFEILTAREREVLQLAAAGYTNREIARRLFISPRTVETHRSSLMHKLRLQNHTELIRFALQKGLITPDLESEAASPANSGPSPLAA